MIFEMILNSKAKKTIVFTILLILSAVALISSTFGWFFAQKFGYGGGMYYNGMKSVGYASMIISIIALFFSIVIGTVQVFSNGFWERYMTLLYLLVIIVVLLLIPSLVMGLLSLFELDNVSVIVNRKWS